MNEPLSPPDLSHLQVIGPYGESVGRIVNYVVSDFVKLCPAVISAVRHDGNPDLLVLSSWVTSGGLAFLSKEVLLHKVPHYPRLREGHWSWREDEGGVCPKHHFAGCQECKFPGWYKPIVNPPETR